MALAARAIVPADRPPAAAPEAEAAALADELAALRLRRASRLRPGWGTSDLKEASDTLSLLRESLDRFTAAARAQEERHAAELAAAQAERAAATREAQARADEAQELRDRLDTLSYDVQADRDLHAAELADAEALTDAARQRIAALQRELSDARERTAAIGDATEAEAERHAAELARAEAASAKALDARDAVTAAAAVAAEAVQAHIATLQAELATARAEVHDGQRERDALSASAVAAAMAAQERISGLEGELADARFAADGAVRERDATRRERDTALAALEVARGEAQAHAAKAAELRDRLAYAVAETVREERDVARRLVATEAEEVAAAVWRLGEMGAEIESLRWQVSELIDVRDHYATYRERAERRERDRAEAELAKAAALAPAPARRGRIRRHGWVVGMTAGVLLAGDGVATIIWQEPISALYTQQEQGRLGEQLPKLIERFAARGSRAAPSLAEQARLLGRTAKSGQAIGRVEIPAIGARFVMVQGTETGTLKLGPGHYTGTRLPGQPGTTAVAGHRTTFGGPFRNLDRLRSGARIVLRMPYGRFVYRVSGRRAVSPTQTGILRSAGRAQRLVLTTCDPMFSDARRLAVFARLVKR